MTIKLKDINVTVRAVQPKVRVTKTGSDKVGVVKLFMELEDGAGFLSGIGRGEMKLWPGGVGLVLSVPTPEIGVRSTLKVGKTETTFEMDAHLTLTVLPENRVGVLMTMHGHLADKAVTSLWGIQAEGGATATIESIQTSIED